MTRADTGLLVLELSAEMAGHLTIAVQSHERWCRSNGLAFPPELPELVTALANRATRGQDGSPLSDLWQVRQAPSVPTKLIDYADAARMLGVSVNTVKRLMKAGDLTPVHVLGSTRLQVEEIEQYIQQLANTSTPTTSKDVA